MIHPVVMDFDVVKNIIRSKAKHAYKITIEARHNL
jgi:hypothetical protein